jgi:radical SAM protein with 4Fe4S-binding SPASM domain
LKGRIDEFAAFWKDKADQVSYNEMLDNIPDDISPVRSSWICPFPYQRMMVMWDGTVTTCYNDFYARSALGNIKSDTIKKCWGAPMEKIRRLHREGRSHEIEACAKCPLRASEIAKR